MIQVSIIVQNKCMVFDTVSTIVQYKGIIFDTGQLIS